MNPSTIIHAEKLGFINRLESSFGEVRIDSIRRISLATDCLLQDHLRSCLVRHSRPLFAATHANEQKHIVEVTGRPYVFEFARAANRESCLSVRLVPRGRSAKPSQIRYANKIVKISVPAQYSSVMYCLPKQCPIRDESLLNSITEGIFDVGQKWVEEKMVKCVSEASHAMDCRLYDHMRVVVPDKRLLDRFVFSELSDGLDRVVPRAESFRTAISIAARTARKLGRCPMDVAAQAMTQAIPKADSVIEDATRSETTIDLPLASTVYYQTDGGFKDAVGAVLGPSISCFPILREGQSPLVSFFPIEMRSSLEPILIANQSHLEEIAKQRAARLRDDRPTSLTPQSHELWRIRAELFGTVIGKCLSQIIKDTFKLGR